MAGGVAALIVWCGAMRAVAQDGCVADLDQDGVVTAGDIDVVVAAVFDTDLPSPPGPVDVNGDGSVTTADVVAVSQLIGAPCGRPTATPTVRATRTPTRVRTPTPGGPTVTPTRPQAATPTSTVTPTTTPTPACPVQAIGLGTTNGTVSASDCLRTIANSSRYADVYAIAGTPGSVLHVQVAGTAPFVPYLAVYDADGQFDSVEGNSPIDFVVTTTRPYQIAVTSSPSTLVPFGAYTLTLASVPCPTPRVLTFGTSVTNPRPSIDATDCPDPGSPSVGDAPDPADQYTFSIPALACSKSGDACTTAGAQCPSNGGTCQSNLPKNVRIKMQQLNLNDDIFPLLTVLGPDGYELVNQDLGLDCTGATSDLVCTEVRFLALTPGTYTVIATGGGGTGTYFLLLDSPRCTSTALSNIPPDHPLTCQGAQNGCPGILYGDVLKTPCASVLPPPDSITGLPEPGSPANLYTFAAAAGDVISADMKTTGADVHLFLLSPDNNVISEDDSTSGAQLAATLPTAGTYTIVAANNTAMASDDPPVNYTLFVQKCPFRSALSLSGTITSGSFNTLDCFGTGDIPYASYLLRGQAGQFVTATVSSSQFDPVMRLYGPDGIVVENDNDLFDPAGTTARVNRILPVTGDYFVEVSASPNDPPVVTTNPPPSFSLRAGTCPLTSTGPGTITGRWEDGDCQMGGRPVDVYSYTASGIGGGGAAIQVPPANGCVMALLASGDQVPTAGCTGEAVNVPVPDGVTQGFIIAPLQPGTRGNYSASLSRCPTTLLGFGDVRVANLAVTDCPNADGAPADWFFVQGSSGLVQFNFGSSGEVAGNFPIAGVLTSLQGNSAFTDSFTGDPSTMYTIGGNLGFLVSVTGASPTDRGAYTISIDPASYRQ